MPDDYYVSQYSGEEIDALLGGAGAGTVRYDAAQTLTDSQKTQARGNIGAAPAGYGLGTTNVNGESYDANNCTQNGWYFCEVNTPNSEWWYILTVSNYANYSIVQKAWYYNNGKVLECMRLGWLGKSEDQGGGWQPWEYVNPPMQPGVEYRTTERYLGKPVYIRLEEIAALPNNTTLTVSKVGVPSGGTLYVDNIVDYRAEFYFNSAVFSIPYNDVVDIPECNGSRYGGGITYSIRTKGVDYSNYAGRIWIKYTKQTDQ